MEKRYQIELDRNERDFATFLKSRDISLSQNELKVLIASRSKMSKDSMFDAENFLKKLVGHTVPPHKLLYKTCSKNIKTYQSKPSRLLY